MKKWFVSTIVICIIVNCSSVSAKSDKEILFRDIPWGSSYEEVKKVMGEYEFREKGREDTETDYVEQLLTDIYPQGFNSDVFTNEGGYGAYAYTKDKIDVAGYTSESTCFLFSRNANEDGTITWDNMENLSLYGAYYRIEPVSLESATEDLMEKLSSLYGEPDKYIDDSLEYGYSEDYIYYWYGADDTVVSLASHSYGDEAKPYTYIHISYATYKGDEWLHTADDLITQMKQADEAKSYGTGNTNGL